MPSLKPLPRFSRSGLPPRRFFGQPGLRQLITGILLAFSLLTGMQATASEAAPLAQNSAALSARMKPLLPPTPILPLIYAVKSGA